MKDYETERARIEKEYVGDAQGFYYADFRLRMRRGMEIHEDHRQAVISEYMALPLPVKSGIDDLQF